MSQTESGFFVHCGIQFTAEEHRSWQNRSAAFDGTINSIVQSGDPRRDQVKTAAQQFGLVLAVLAPATRALLSV